MAEQWAFPSHGWIEKRKLGSVFGGRWSGSKASQCDHKKNSAGGSETDEELLADATQQHRFRGLLSSLAEALAVCTSRIQTDISSELGSTSEPSGFRSTW